MEKEDITFISEQAPSEDELKILGKSLCLDLLPNLEDSPEYLNITDIWGIFEMFLSRFGDARELYMGFNTSGDNLSITEIKQGSVMKDCGTDRGLQMAITRIEEKALISIHNHPPLLGVENSLSNNFPEFSEMDIASLLRDKGQYISIVVGPSIKGLIPICLAKKNHQTYEIIKDKEKLIDRLHFLFNLKNFAFKNTSIELFNETKGTSFEENNFTNILATDFLLENLFGLTIYRGFIEESLDKQPILKRSFLRERLKNLNREL